MKHVRPSLDDMTPVSLQRTAPVLHVTSRTMKPVRDFFVDKLGFTIETEIGKGPTFVMLNRDGQNVMLFCSRRFGRAPRGWAAYFWVDDISSLHAEFLSRETPLKGGITDKPHGCRELIALSPDRRELVFAERTSES